MNEHPILFSGEMVRAILEGKKTQTRRIIKSQPMEYVVSAYLRPDGKYIWRCSTGEGVSLPFKCPFGQVGDKLWCRETWFEWTKGNPEKQPYLYRATTSDYDFEMVKQCGHTILWRPSIFMPRCASRITLEITNIQVEELKNITSLGVVAEGIEGNTLDWTELRGRFITLWDSINAKRGYGWDKNPWVWVISFKRVKK